MGRDLIILLAEEGDEEVGSNQIPVGDWCNFESMHPSIISIPQFGDNGEYNDCTRHTACKENWSIDLFDLA